MTAKPIALSIIGANGRMGQAIQAAAGDRYEIGARITRDQADYAALTNTEAVIDVSTGAALVQALPHIPDGVPLVSGTTGLSEIEKTAVADAAGRLPLLRSGNFSVGIAVLQKLARQAAAVLGPDWDVEILEMHHRHKTDAPSGTVLMLGEAVAAGRKITLSDKPVMDRSGARKAGDIGFAVLRGGGVYGLHEVRLVSESEMITLGHQALNRGVFALGALAALDWLIGQPPGLYSMDDVVAV